MSMDGKSSVDMSANSNRGGRVKVDAKWGSARMNVREVSVHAKNGTPRMLALGTTTKEALRCGGDEEKPKMGNVEDAEYEPINSKTGNLLASKEVINTYQKAAVLFTED